MLATLHEDLRTFYRCWQNRFVIKTFHTFTLLTVTFISTTHTKCVVTFPLPQWLRDMGNNVTLYVPRLFFHGILMVWLKKNVVQFY